MPSSSLRCDRSRPRTEPLSSGGLSDPSLAFRTLAWRPSLHAAPLPPHPPAPGPGSPGPALPPPLSAPSSHLVAFPPRCSLRRDTRPSSPGCPSTTLQPLEPLVLPSLTTHSVIIVLMLLLCIRLSPQEGSSVRTGVCVAAAPCVLGPGMHSDCWRRVADAQPIE